MLLLSVPVLANAEAVTIARSAHDFSVSDFQLFPASSRGFSVERIRPTGSNV
jgi:hypothetical protein